MTVVVHCMREPYDVYVGRGVDLRTGERARWGNPFHIGRDGNRTEVIAMYRRWLWDEIRANRLEIAELACLEGKRLGCWCSPDACHGEVLADAAAWAMAQIAAEMDRAVVGAQCES